MSGTGNLRTLRLSSTGSSRTLGSLLASSSSAGAGSTERIFVYYKKLFNNNTALFYKQIFNLEYGEFRRQFNMRRNL
jgi:hypothetical protein